MKEYLGLVLKKGAIILALLACSVTGSWGAMADYCSVPPFLGNSVPPNILIVLDNSGSMNFAAYPGSFDPAQFAGGHYYGYFEPTSNYKYAGSHWEVTTDPLSAGTATNPIANGDFLNWASMRRVDCAKKLLIGGKANPRSPNAGITVKLTGENSPSYRNFSKDFNNSSVPGLIYPFVGNYRYSMSGNNLTLKLLSGSGGGTVRPSGDLSVPAAWQSTGSNAWEAVDESSADTSTYITNKSSKDAALFSYAYTGATIGTIESVTVKVRALKSSSKSTMEVQGVLRINGSDYPAASAALSTKYSDYTFSFDTNPATGAAWQWTDFGSSDLQGFGVKAFTQPTSKNYPTVTQVYMLIEVATPAGGTFKIVVDQGMKKAEGLIDHLGDSVRFGLAYYNQGSGIESGSSYGRNDGGYVANDIDFKVATNMITSIGNLSPDTWTPLAETLYEMIRYFRQETPYYSGNSPADFKVGNNYDPYYFQYSKLAGSNLSDQKVKCAKSFVLMLTDGESTMDKNIPDSLKDYDKDGKDGSIGSDSATDYLDDVALWGSTVDHRADLAGTQNIVLYPVYLFGRGSSLLKDAAINGGFADLNGDNKPGPSPAEYLRDSNGDGTLSAADDLPQTYFEGDDGYELESSLTEAITSIMKRAASGTAVSLLSTSSRGVGSMVQAYYQPSRQEGEREVSWTGYTQNFWVDPDDNLREDSVPDAQLRLAEDKAVKLFFDTASNEAKAALFTTDADGRGGTLEACGTDPDVPASTIEIQPFTGISYLWEAGDKLARRDLSASPRSLFTSKKVIGSFGTSTFADSAFSVANVTSNATLQAALDPDATYTATKIVQYIQGQDLESSSASFRDRRVSLDGALKVWRLGDIIGSSPTLVSNTPANTYHYDYGDLTYFQYMHSDDYRQRSSMAFVGANDGLLHAFRAGYLQERTDLADKVKAIFHNAFSSIAGGQATDQLGQEAWGFIPFNAFPYLKYLANPDYCHIYYNDLSLRVVDVSFGGESNPLPANTKTSGSWKTLLLGGMRFGGACTGGTPTPPSGVSNTGYSAYYALDITDPEHPVPLWEFSDTDLDYATTHASIVRTGAKGINGNWYLVVGSGPEKLPKSATDIDRTTTGYVFIIDLTTGTLVKKIGLGHNAVVADILAIDKDKDYQVEKLYFGTAYKSGSSWKGKLMTLNFPQTETAMQELCGVGVTRTYAQCQAVASPPLTTLFDDAYPFTSTPDVAADGYGNTWVYIGSGKYYSDVDKTDASDQILMGIKDTGTTVLKSTLDNRSSHSTTGTVTGTTKACLYDESAGTFKEMMMVTSIKLGSSSSIPSPSSKGWYIPLSGGERVISRPLAVGGLVDFLSYTPFSDPCSSGGETNLYALDYIRGIAPSTIALRSPDVTSGVATGTVTVKKKIRLGPGAPPSGEAIVISPPKEGNEFRLKKIQTSTGVVTEAANKPNLDTGTRIIHWLNQ